MTTLTYQVEYMSRPDEIDHVIPYGGDYRGACSFARRMSDKHDGSAYVVALREVEDEGGKRTMAVGHIVYVFGMRNEVEGELKSAA